MVWRLPEQQREGLSPEGAELGFEEVELLAVGALHSALQGQFPGKGAEPGSCSPSSTTSKGHPRGFLKGELKTEWIYPQSHASYSSELHQTKEGWVWGFVTLCVTENAVI